MSASCSVCPWEAASISARIKGAGNVLPLASARRSIPGRQVGGQFGSRCVTYLDDHHHAHRQVRNALDAVHARQLQALHVVLGQRVVGGADAELHGHVQAGRGLAATRHANQNQVGLVVVVGTRAVVVVQGEVHRLDAFHVVGVTANRVRFTHGIRRMGGQFLLERG